jgi:hypothetical protein
MFMPKNNLAEFLERNLPILVCVSLVDGAVSDAVKLLKGKSMIIGNSFAN